MYLDFNNSVAITGSADSSFGWKILGIESYEDLLEHRFALGDRVSIDDFIERTASFVFIGCLSDVTLELLRKRKFDSIAFIGCRLGAKEMEVACQGVKSLTLDLCDLSNLTQSHPLQVDNLVLSGCFNSGGAEEMRCETLVMRFPTYVPNPYSLSTCRRIFAYGKDYDPSSLLSDHIKHCASLENLYVSGMDISLSDLLTFLEASAREVEISSSIIHSDGALASDPIASKVRRLSFSSDVVTDKTSLMEIIKHCSYLSFLKLPPVAIDRELLELLVELPLQELDASQCRLRKDAVKEIGELPLSLILSDNQRRKYRTLNHSAD